MILRLKRFFATVILVALLVSLTSCGYFLYPERRYQQKGEVDFPIMILDGSSLLFAAVAGQAVIAVIGVVICIELRKTTNKSASTLNELTAELLRIAESHDCTRQIKNILYHPGFPVDIRHNSKISREKLALWAEEQV